MTTLTTLLESDAELVERAVGACKRGEIAAALELLAQAIAQDGTNESAWLWLSGLVATDSERRFCLNRVLQLNPNSAAARHGLKLLPAEQTAQPPALARSDMVEACMFPGCRGARRASSPYCFGHWMAIYRPSVRSTPEPPTSVETEQPASFSASALAERLGVPTHMLLATCAELGWVQRGDRGWVVTVSGQAVGAVQQHHPETGVPFVHWPASILDHPALPRTLRHLRAADTPTKSRGERSLREQCPAQYRTIDGHLVRSQAELQIDNWLYNANIVHAYERLLPAEEEAYCDFYLPLGRVFIEYVGVERTEALRSRAETKAVLYARLGLNLVVLDDDHIRNLAGCLRVLLAQFGM